MEKKSSLTRLSLRLGSVRTRLNSIFPQKLHRKPINPLDPPTTNNLISPLSKQTNKRAIEFLGNVISYITGVPSPSEWRLNQENIRHLKNAMIKLTKLDNEIGKRISTNSHHLSVINQKLNSLTLSLNYTTNKINLMEQDMRANLIFEALETGTLSTLECLESFLSGIENVIFKGHFNLASVEGISHEFIRDAIVDIQSSFKTLSPIFGMDSINSYYESPLATVSLHDSEVWTSVKIPLVNFNNLYKRLLDTSPYAIELNQLNSLGARNPLWYTNKMERNIFLSKDLQEKCLFVRNTYICQGRSVIINSRFIKGENEIENFWSETDNHGYIAYSNKENISAQLLCGNQKHDIEIGTRGLLFLQDSCSLKSEKVLIGEVKNRIYESTKWSRKYHVIDYSVADKLLMEKLPATINTNLELESTVTEPEISQETEMLDELEEVVVPTTSPASSLVHAGISAGFMVIFLIVTLATLYLSWKTMIYCKLNKRRKNTKKTNEQECWRKENSSKESMNSIPTDAIPKGVNAQFDISTDREYDELEQQKKHKNCDTRMTKETSFTNRYGNEKEN